MPLTFTRRGFASLLALTPFLSPARAEESWDDIEKQARGQTVYFNAWAGSPQVNDYIAWAAGELATRHGITLEHVKLSDTGEAVRRVRDEVKAGRQGSVDLIWINGQNFHVMKEEQLLFGPFTGDLPNFALVDTDGKPTTLVDFAEGTEGLESPWGMAQLTFFADGAKLDTPPMSMLELLDLARDEPGRITYPAPPDFHGTTFVKQALVETIDDRALLPLAIDKDTFTEATQPLFEFLDQLHPYLWREGKQFPPTQAQVTQMLSDGELLMGLTFNPNEAANLVSAGTLPDTTIAWQNRGGSIGNSHFVAIPINSNSKAAAQVVADFLLSPEAQARKADLKIWGDPTVLDMDKLTPAQRALFTGGDAPGAVKDPARTIPEPHGSWVPLLEAAWLERYGA
ncbi:ABC transporter substrate-binding protein [Aestuariivirga litoralis]|uniref:ABC transporter substrate-binding protein n=1 Tax=Aestuariivirga litoralis TaxID=2650924 RepID=A0A2W2ALX7_9HYPH|nr:ABC transporter substrate-binding protein [Aestuariivirga litoralis]PZF76555.1 ABC transporter substrate-binding protein [Aestuariivirga litoralis]